MSCMPITCTEDIQHICYHELAIWAASKAVTAGSLHTAVAPLTPYCGCTLTWYPFPWQQEGCNEPYTLKPCQPHLPTPPHTQWLSCRCTLQMDTCKFRQGASTPRLLSLNPNFLATCNPRPLRKVSCTARSTQVKTLADVAAHVVVLAAFPR